ncbi:MAG: methyltransferase domain-containing protein [Cyanobacteria bacterium P01_A01_bin.84]
MAHPNDELVLYSWNKNARGWINAIKNEEIESRKIITNSAILDAITTYSPDSILDIGCGEGWLTRELTKLDINTTGVDGVPTLIENAQSQGYGKFLFASYEDIVAGGKINNNYFDAAVCNFSLLGKGSVEKLVDFIPNLLTKNGLFFIQTLHPVISSTELPYENGWREESWHNFNSQFQETAPWYFRTLETWIKLLISSGFSIIECIEPIHPITQKPASIIFVVRYANNSYSY